MEKALQKNDTQTINTYIENNRLPEKYINLLQNVVGEKLDKIRKILKQTENFIQRRQEEFSRVVKADNLEKVRELLQQGAVFDTHIFSIAIANGAINTTQFFLDIEEKEGTIEGLKELIREGIKSTPIDIYREKEINNREKTIVLLLDYAFEYDKELFDKTISLLNKEQVLHFQKPLAEQKIINLIFMRGYDFALEIFGPKGVIMEAMYALNFSVLDMYPLESTHVVDYMSKVFVRHSPINRIFGIINTKAEIEPIDFIPLVQYYIDRGLDLRIGHANPGLDQFLGRVRIRGQEGEDIYPYKLIDAAVEGFNKNLVKFLLDMYPSLYKRLTLNINRYRKLLGRLDNEEEIEFIRSYVSYLAKLYNEKISDGEKDYEYVYDIPDDDEKFDEEREGTSNRKVQQHCVQKKGIDEEPLDDTELVILLRPPRPEGECYKRSELMEIFSKAEKVYEWSGPPAGYTSPLGYDHPHPILEKPVYKLPWSGMWVDKTVAELLYHGADVIFLEGRKQSIGSGYGVSALHGQWGGNWKIHNGEALYVEDGNAYIDEREIVYSGRPGIL